MSIVTTLWTYTRGVETISLHFALLFDNKNGSEPRKTCNSFPPIFLLTLNQLKLWQPRQLYQPCGIKHEVLGYKKYNYLEFVVKQIP